MIKVQIVEDGPGAYRRVYTRLPPFERLNGRTVEWVTEGLQDEPKHLVEIWEALGLVPAFRDAHRKLLGLVDPVEPAADLAIEVCRLARRRDDVLVLKVPAGNVRHFDPNAIERVENAVRGAGYPGICIALIGDVDGGFDLAELGDEDGRRLYAALRARYRGAR